MNLLKLFDITEKKLASTQALLDHSHRDIHTQHLAEDKEYYLEILAILFERLEK